MIDLLLTHAQILTMDDAQPLLKDAYLGVTDGKITYLSEAEPQETAKVRKDMTGKILLPGLINTHAHLGMSTLRGYSDDCALQSWLYDHIFPAEARMDQRAVRAGVQLALAEMTAHGITSFSDMYFYEPQTAELTLQAGLRGNLTNSVLALDPDSFVLEKDRSYTETVELTQNWNGAGNGRIRADVSLHAEYTTYPALWEWARLFAQEHHVGIQLHLSETEREHREAIERWGKTPTQILAQYGVFDARVCAAHGVWLDEADGALLAAHGASVAHCPSSNLKLGSGIAPVTRLIEQGVNMTLGTDGACSNNSLDLFREMRLAALLQKGTQHRADVMSAMQVLKMATVNGAKAQGRDDVGILRKGMQADIIAVDATAPHLRPGKDPASVLVYCASGADVCMTVVQGEILYENGVYARLDTEKILWEVEHYALPKAAGEI